MRRDWTKWGAELTGPRFAEFQTALAKYNATRFDPGLPEEAPADQICAGITGCRGRDYFVEAASQG